MAGQQVQLIGSDGKPIGITNGRLHIVTGTTVQAAMLLVESTVPTEYTDGDKVLQQGTTFGEAVNAGYDKSQNAQGIVDKDPFPAKSGYEQLIDVVLDADPTTSTSSPFFIGDKQKLTLFFKTDVTIVGAAPEVTYTVELSPDGTEWIVFDQLIDATGVDSPVASLTHDADAEKILGIQDFYTAQYLRVVATGANTDADDTCDCDVWITWKKG